MREKGCYWGKVKGRWGIYYWDGNFWYTFGPGIILAKSYFDEIDEKQIKRE